LRSPPTRAGVAVRVGGDRKDRLGVDGHAVLGPRAVELAEDLVVVDDDSVVDPDHRSMPDRMVVGRDRRVALRVVAHVDEELGRGGGNVDPLQELARGCPLLRHDRVGIAGNAVRVPDRVGSPLGDPGQQRLRGERPIDAATGREAVSGDSAHVWSHRPR